MEWEFIAPMVTFIVLILTVGGVLILRPLSHRLAELLEVMTRQKSVDGERAELRRLAEAVDYLSQRLELVEQRQEFTDRLLEARPRERQLPAETADRSS